MNIIELYKNLKDSYKSYLESFVTILILENFM